MKFLGKVRFQYRVFKVNMIIASVKLQRGVWFYFTVSKLSSSPALNNKTLNEVLCIKRQNLRSNNELYC